VLLLVSVNPLLGVPGASADLLILFTLYWLCFEAALMDSPAGSSSPTDTHDVPDWANFPLTPDGKLDAERLMPTTFEVCSKEYCKSREDLAKSLPSLAPKRERYETKSVPTITNLTLLELFDLSGEEIVEFRSSVLETLGEYDRINNMEKLMTNLGSIRRSMMELRRVANGIHSKKSREESTAFLCKRANLAILGYFTRQDPRNQPVQPTVSRSVQSHRPVGRQFKDFLLGNKGAARVSAYNWRHKKWDESVNRNLSIRQSDGDLPRTVASKEEVVHDSDGLGGSAEICLSSPTVSPSSHSLPDAKKMRMEEGFNMQNAVAKGRDELNFYCAVKANKVNPEGFGIPKGFVLCGDKIVHHTKKGKVDRMGMKRKRASKKGRDQKEPEAKEGCVEISEKETKKNDLPTEKNEEEAELANVNESMGNEVVVMEDIEEEEGETEEEIEIHDGKQPVFTTESSTQTDDTVDIMETASGDTVISPEIAAQLAMLESTHAQDVGTIQKLRAENVLAVKNLSKIHNKYVSLMMDRNNIKCAFNTVEKNRKTLKFENVHLTRSVKQLNEQNAMLLHEVNALKRDIAIRDQMEGSNGEVGRYEEYSG
ncbi:hypothetical protein PMAYCL1PPCAC_23523, partial [Pristionchus mayeri]